MRSYNGVNVALSHAFSEPRLRRPTPWWSSPTSYFTDNDHHPTDSLSDASQDETRRTMRRWATERAREQMATLFAVDGNGVLHSFPTQVTLMEEYMRSSWRSCRRRAQPPRPPRRQSDEQVGIRRDCAPCHVL